MKSNSAQINLNSLFLMKFVYIIIMMDVTVNKKY